MHCLFSNRMTSNVNKISIRVVAVASTAYASPELQFCVDVNIHSLDCMRLKWMASLYLAVCVCLCFIKAQFDFSVSHYCSCCIFTFVLIAWTCSVQMWVSRVIQWVLNFNFTTIHNWISKWNSVYYTQANSRQQFKCDCVPVHSLFFLSLFRFFLFPLIQCLYIRTGWGNNFHNILYNGVCVIISILWKTFSHRVRKLYVRACVRSLLCKQLKIR